MPSTFERLLQLSQLGGHITDAIAVVKKFRAAEKAVRAAKSGDLVNGGTVKGIRIGGKVCDLDLPLHVR